jgi:flagellar biosynthesis/type III secretory pathway protein FliH
MSDVTPPRVADVRPARVWQPSDLMGAASRPEGFVQHAWASSSAKNYWVQEVITETLLLKASDPVETSSSDAEEADSSAQSGLEEGQADELTERVEKPEQGFTDEFLAQIRAEAYAEGVAESRLNLRAEMEAEFAAGQTHDQTLLEALQSALDELKRSPQPFYEPLKRLALHLAEQLVLGELSMDGRAVERLLQRCLDDLASHNESVILVELNPDDLVLFEALQDRVGMTSGPALRLQADASLKPGSVRVSANDAIVEDLIEHRLEALARDLGVDEPRWKSQSGFESSRLSEMRASAQKSVEDARPRMASQPGLEERSVIDDLLAESEDDV